MTGGSTSHRGVRGGVRGDVVVLVLGVVYLLLSVIGFLTVGLDEFGQEKPVRALGFLGVSTLLNIVHGLIGVLLTAAGLSHRAAGFAPIATVAFTVLTVFGVVARIFGGSGDPLNLDWWNIGLFAVSAVVCVWVYLTAVWPLSRSRG